MTMIRVRRDTTLAVGSIPMHPNVDNACRLRDAILLSLLDPRSGNRVTESTLDGTVGRRFAPVSYEGSAVSLSPGRQQ